jgi:hypothetical protein
VKPVEADTVSTHQKKKKKKKKNPPLREPDSHAGSVLLAS